MRRLRGGLIWLAALGAVFADVPDASAQPPLSPDAIRQKVGEVFSRPEFQPREPGRGNWLFRQFLAFLEWLGGLSTTAPLLFWFLLCACILVLIVILTMIVLQVRKVFGADAHARQAEAAARRKGLAAEYREEANRRAAAGEYTEAVRYLFLSLIYRLDERGRVSLHQAYTNREYLELLGDRLPTPDALGIIVDTLDDCWYGQRPCRLSQYEACLAVYERLVEAS